MDKKTYYIKGMHCASCEVLIEKKVLEIDGVEFANASLSSGTLDMGYNKERPSLNLLNRTFRENGYAFSDRPFSGSDNKLETMALPFAIAALIIGLFLLSSKLGLSSFINISSNSSLPAFLVLGLIAGVSSCAALVGGLILSLSKQWVQLYGKTDSFFEKAKPHLFFNFGRIISYAGVGSLLGVLGARFKISSSITSLLVLAVSLVMLILALQMIGIKWFNRFRIALPKSLSSRITNDNRPVSRFMPFVVGFLTFLLPCGFTLIAEGMAVLSGSALKGLMIMTFFALGTMTPLLLIGFSSAKLVLNPKTSERFLKVTGLVVIFFVLFNLNFQFGITQYLASVKAVSGSQSSGSSSLPLSNGANNNVRAAGVQTIRAVYTERNDIVPSRFEVKAGQPVRFEVDVKDNGYGCMSTIMVPGLWNSPQLLRKGQLIVMQFTPSRSGSYKITCAMGVPRGTITVQ